MDGDGMGMGGIQHSMADLITPTYGNTPQGAQLSQGASAPINAIPNPLNLQNTPSSTLMSDYTGAANTANQMTADTPAWQEQQQTALQGQAQLPQISNQYGLDYNTFAKILANDPLGQRYLASEGAYNSPDQVGNFTGTSPTAPGIVSTLPEATLGNVNDPFSGFTDPGLAFGAGGTEEAGISDVMNNLASLFGWNQGQVMSQLSKNLTNRQNQISAISNLANVFLNAYNAKQSATAVNGPGSVVDAQNQMSRDIQKGMTFTDLMATYGNTLPEYTIRNAYNQGPMAKKYGQAKETPQEAVQYAMGVYSKPSASATQKKQTAEQNAVAALKGFGDFMGSYYNGTIDIGGARILNPFGQQYSGQQGIYVNQLKKAIGASKAAQVTRDIQSHLPGEISTSAAAEQQFKGHLKQVMDAAQVRFVSDKSGNVFIVGQSDFDPKTEREVSVDQFSVDQLQQILGSL